MSAYGTKAPIAIYLGDTEVVWSTEKPATNAASQAVALDISREPQNISVEIVFSGAPGTFSVSVQTADTDATGAYTTFSGASAITAVNAAYYASLQLIDLRCNFVRLFMTDDPSNDVSITARITR